MNDLIHHSKVFWLFDRGVWIGTFEFCLGLRAWLIPRAEYHIMTFGGAVEEVYIRVVC